MRCSVHPTSLKKFSPGLNRSCSYSYEVSPRQEDVSPNENSDDYSRSPRRYIRLNSKNCDDCGASSLFDITRQEHDHDALRSATEIGHGCPP